MILINSDPDCREPDWEGLQRLVQTSLEAFKSARRRDVDALRAQIESATVRQIDFTGHGFYAELAVPTSAPQLTEPTIYGAILAVAVCGDDIVGLNLFLGTDARILSLEGFNCGDIPFTGAAAYRVEMREHQEPQ